MEKMDSPFDMLHPLLQEALKNKGFTQATLPQQKGIPAILGGSHVVIIARTGSGKTESAVLPIISKILELKERKKGIKALYIAPLRALNRDIMERLQWWADELGISVSVRHGDTTQYERRKQALSPPDLLVTTPETLQAMLTGKVMRKNLSTVGAVVVDEIHELAADKRGIQLSAGLERLGTLAGEFRRIGLSATVGTPEEIARFLGGDRDVSILDATVQKSFDIQIEYPVSVPEDEELAATLATTPHNAARVRRLSEIIGENKSVLTFVNTREMAEALSSRLNVVTKDVDVHHSSLAKKVRIETEKKFKSQDIKCIICTSSMELGIDVGSVSLVVQYMSPRQVSRLIQRVGRSGHKYTEIPRGVLMTVDADDVLESLVIARRAKEGILEATSVYDAPYDVLAHQLVGLSMDAGDVSEDAAYRLITRAYPYRNLSREEFDSVLGHLSLIRLIWREEGSYHKSRYALKYYFDNLSVIPDVKKFKVLEIGTNRTIGVLDEDFVADRANIGMTFVMKGRAWTVLDTSEELVIVEEAGNMAAPPAWEGELIPVPHDIAQEVFRLRRYISEHRNVLEKVDALRNRYPMDDAAYDAVERYVVSQEDIGVPKPGNIMLESLPGMAVFHTGFGSIVNETIGRALAALYSTRFGTSVAMKSDAYCIAFKFPASVVLDDITSVLDSVQPQDIRPILELSLKRTTLFLWKFTHVATRFGVLSKDAEKFKIRAIMGSYRDTPVYEETYKELFHDKLDVATSEKIIEDYRSGTISLDIVERKNPSPFCGTILSKFGYGELIGPKRPEKEILKLLKKRLEDRRVQLFCILCGRWNASVKISTMDEHPKCPLCGSRFLAIIDKKDKKTRAAILKRTKKQKISEEEEELVIRAKRTADLILVYGKGAAIALSGRGVGAQTAARILAKMHPDEQSLLRDILEAEKNYARTRRFWD